MSLFSLRPKVGDTWEVRFPGKPKKTKTIGKIFKRWVCKTKEAKRDTMHFYMEWERLPKGRYSGCFLPALLKYGRRVKTAAEAAKEREAANERFEAQIAEGKARLRAQSTPTETVGSAGARQGGEPV